MIQRLIVADMKRNSAGPSSTGSFSEVQRRPKARTTSNAKVPKVVLHSCDSIAPPPRTAELPAEDPISA